LKKIHETCLKCEKTIFLKTYIHSWQPGKKMQT
jgi:hypothetical protein